MELPPFICRRPPPPAALSTPPPPDGFPHVPACFLKIFPVEYTSWSLSANSVLECWSAESLNANTVDKALSGALLQAVHRLLQRRHRAAAPAAHQPLSSHRDVAAAVGAQLRHCPADARPLQQRQVDLQAAREGGQERKVRQRRLAWKTGRMRCLARNACWCLKEEEPHLDPGQFLQDAQRLFGGHKCPAAHRRVVSCTGGAQGWWLVGGGWRALGLAPLAET